MEFLELIDTIEAEEGRRPVKLFAGESTAACGLAADKARSKRLAEAARLHRDARSGRRPHAKALMVKEAMTTSDFPLLFGDILDRQLLASYADWPVNVDQQIARQRDGPRLPAT
jgi:hypothetical protein